MTTDNERLITGMTTESPRYKEYLSLMQQCKKEAETESERFKGFFDLSTAHEKADDILCHLIIDLGFKEIIDIYKSFDKWYA